MEKNNTEIKNKKEKRKNLRYKIDNLSLLFGITTLLTSLIHLNLIYSLETQPPLKSPKPVQKALKSTLPATLADIKRNLTHFQIQKKKNFLKESEWICLLYNSGGRAVPPIRHKMQFWRLGSSIFLHTDFRHLLSNLFMLYFLLKIVKNFYKEKGIIFGFFKCGFIANFIGCFFCPNELVVGLSPGVFGVLGMLIFEIFYIKIKKINSFFLGKLGREELDFAFREDCEENIAKKVEKVEQKNWNFKVLISLIILFFGIYNPSNRMDVSSHIFGMILGFFYGGFEVLKELDFFKKKRKILTVFEILFTLFALFFTFRAFMIKFDTEEMALAAAVNMGCN